MDEPMAGSLSPRSVGQRAKKSRASKPKVKTGCQTCKIRRVKCDETKPFCLRCTKFGHTCDGYAPSALSRSTCSGSITRAIIPKIAIQRQIAPIAAIAPIPVAPSSPADPIRLAPIRPAMYKSPTQTVFPDEEEYRCFQQFYTQTSRQLSSFFTKDLWNQIMLQACETSPPIRHVIISIGALNLSSRKPQLGEVGTLRHQFAYRQYSKSICLMRRDIAGNSQDLRTTLIGCLLFYCFETFHGYQELAISQVYSGLRMIREWSAILYKPDAEGKINSNLGSENPYIVEDDILRAFGNLEIQVMSYADGRNADLHEHYRQSGQASIDEMEVEFQNLMDARAMLELVIRRSMHWLRSTMHLQSFSPSEGKDKYGYFGSDSDGKESESQASLFFDVDPSFEEQTATLKEYEKWESAFRPMLKNARTLTRGEAFLMANALRLYWLAGYLSIASNNCRTSVINSGKFISELNELVEIARLLEENHAKEEKSETGCAFDMQIAVPLMTVAWVYRHRALRRHAIRLLFESPRKEGVWDGAVVGKIMEWLANVEDESMQPGDDKEEYVYEKAAARCIKMSFDMEKREAYASCLQSVGGSLNGCETKREIAIPW